MIKLKDISKEYVSKYHQKKLALSGINLEFANKGFYAIVGKSGSGKTTLLNTIAGLIKPTEGSVKYDNLDMNDISDNGFDDLRKKYFSFINQDFLLLDRLTVLDNLKLALSIQGKEFDEELNTKINYILTKVGIEDLSGKCIYELSGGEKQRVAIARSLIKDSKVILADEPTGSLDDENTKAIFDLLKGLSKERLVIVVTHDQDLALNVADIIIRISNGQISEVKNKIILDDFKERELVVQKNKESYKTISFLSKLILGKRPFTTAFSAFFWVVSLTLLISALSAIMFNKYDFTYDTVKENQIAGVILAKDNDNGLYSAFDETLLDLSNSSKMTQIYRNANIYKRMLVKDRSLSVSSDKIFKNLIITEMSDDEIEITDFLLDDLIQSGLIVANSVEECLNKYIYYGEYALKISKVIETDYKEMLTSKNEILKRQKEEYDYDLVRMSWNSYCKLSNEAMNFFMVTCANENLYRYENEEERDFFIQNFSEIGIGNSFHLQESLGVITDYWGEINEVSGNEIIINTNTVDMLGLVEYDQSNKDEKMASLINHPVNLSLTYKGNDYSCDFVIKGIVPYITMYSSNEVYVSDEVYHACLADMQYYLADDEQYFVNMCTNIYPFFETGERGEMLRLFKDVEDNGGVYLTSVSTVIDSTIKGIEFFSDIFEVAVYASLGFLIVCLFFFSVRNIHDCKRELGIICSLGVTKRGITKMVLWRNLIVLAYSFIIACIFSIVVIAFLNVQFCSITNMEGHNIINFEFLGLIISLFVSLLVLFICVGLSILFLKRQEITRVIYS